MVKRVKSHFDNCNNGSEETPVQGRLQLHSDPAGDGGRGAPM